MIIRKEFRVESAHVVRNCTSDRCSHSVHGHSAVIEVMLEGDTLDNAGMLYDFGLLKGTVKQFVDASDHCMLIWNKDTKEYRDFFKAENKRWIELPFNPSAEQLCMFYHVFIQYILDHTVANNGEDVHLKVKGVRYHETTTGWAECDEKDIKKLWKKEWFNEVTFSAGVIDDWSTDLRRIIFNEESVENPVIDLQVK